ncbi:MAG TPA: agmatine deiminase family protein, partial [Desulfuromonadales bacterium]|nr:agmatine deiminase family protein [Desulfuromonadales bacterium]
MNPRLPAEWEAQDGVLMAWPHEATDWADMLNEVRPVFADIIRHICRFEKVVLVTPDARTTEEHLRAQDIALDNILICEMPSNDTWARDFGPLTVIYNDRPTLLDFGFNGWGLKFPAQHDNLITRNLKQQGVVKPKVNTIGMVFEGGSIETDGLGTILTTTA